MIPVVSSVAFLGLSPYGSVGSAGAVWNGYWLVDDDASRASVVVHAVSGTVEVDDRRAHGPRRILWLTDGPVPSCDEVGKRIERVGEAARALMDQIPGSGRRVVVPLDQACTELGALLALDPAAREPRLASHWMLWAADRGGYLERWDRLRTPSALWDPATCSIPAHDTAWCGVSSQWTAPGLQGDIALSGPIAENTWTYPTAGWLDARFDVPQCAVDLGPEVRTNDD